MNIASENPKSSGKAVIELPARLDISVCEELAQKFNSSRNSEIYVVADKVTHIGALALQLLLSARLQWDADEHPFFISSPSIAFNEGIALLGYDQSPFQEGAIA
ncbi:hypothetical protein [Aestuariibius sp. HNIBRBA575]|uniref:hypothetical protein n=1 Tax=Aestuariibius sp. HNIBRBA575 TaxID=3233343 RepID=UPI0034A4EEF0